jgi:uncharacterized membrane protein
MSGTLWHLVAAVAAFGGGHVLVSSTPLRGLLMARFGAKAYRGFYSLIAAAALVWMIHAYIGAPVVDLWTPNTAARHLSLTVMLIASILFVCGVATPNPTLVGGGRLAAAGPVGIIKVTRHPMMWAFGLWGLTHIAAKGDAASVIFFGSLAALALVGTQLIDRRKRTSMGEAWPPFAAATSNLPLAAIIGGRVRVGLGEIGYGRLLGGVALYAVLLFGHPFIFGPDVLP